MTEETNLFLKNKKLRENKDHLKAKVSEEDYILIKNSKFFSKDYYLSNYPEVKEEGYDPIVHYILEGFVKGYNPNFNFDNNLYIEANSDVKDAGINPLIHYLKWGINERRACYSVPPKRKKSLAALKHNILNKLKYPDLYLLVASRFNIRAFKENKKQYITIKNSGLFDEKFYIKNYPEVENFGNDLILHYMFIGSKFNFKPNKYFDTNYYKQTYTFNGNPLYDYIINQNGSEISFLQNVRNKEAYSIIKNSKLFDEEFYLNNYSEVTIDPILHYIYFGFKKGYNPSSQFNTNWYCENYPEVKFDVLNPLVHYIKYGKDEGRLPKPLTKDEANKIMAKIENNAKNTSLYDFKEDAPLVSIVILNRNGIDYLKTLFSDFSQTICYPNYEIIVVDNASSDDSIEYLKKVANDLPLKIIKNDTNESFSTANNKAVEIAEGEYIVLLNNDMEPIYGWLNHLMSSYLKFDDVGIVGAKLIFPFKEGDPTSLKTQNEGIKFMEFNGFYEEDDGFTVPYNIKENDVFKSDEELEMGAILGACLLIKKDLYTQLGGLDDRFIYNYEDIDLCFKAIDNGYKVIYNPKAQLYHYYQATRDDPFNFSPTDFKNRFYLLRKWNQWITEKLFVDKLKGDMIFSENPIRVSFVSIKDYLKDNNTLNWDYNFIKFNPFSDIQIKNNSDILISDIYNFDLESAIINNIHQVKVAVVKNNVDRWINSGNLVDYDVILTVNEYFDKLSKDYPNVFKIDDNSIFERIRDILLDIHTSNNKKFNNLISNPDFLGILDNAIHYMAILESEYFDEEWYLEHNDISNYNGDAASHYLDVGGHNGKNPGPNFSSKNYLNSNLDVKGNGFNPLSHYELFGRAEGRHLNYSFKEYLSYKLFLFLTNESILPFTKKLFKVKDDRVLFYSPWDDETEGQLSENSQIVYDNLNDDYDKIIHTKKSISLGEYFNLLKKVCTSKIIIIDNGFSLLSNIKLDGNQDVINIWHACGAFKKIAHDVPEYSYETLEHIDLEFKQYSNFIVSSESIVPIYANAHNMDKKDVLPLGVPRTDILFNKKVINNELDKLYKDYPNLKDKHVILYTPTFRSAYKFYPDIDWDDLSKRLDDNKVFVIKRHPRMIEDLMQGKTYDNIFYIEDESLFSLMFASDVMITDYSSTIFEYSLLNKPVIHYCPDFNDYVDARGFYLDFNSELYGDIIKNSQKLVDVIVNEEYEVNSEALEKFKNKFMSSCDGKSTERVINLIEKKIKD